MTKEAIFEKLKELAEGNLHLSEDINPSSKLRSDIGVDSIELMEFVISVEDTFGIEISDAIIDELVTIQDVLDYVSQQLGNK